MNLAAIWRLPVLFVCENNRYSEMTPIAAMAPYAEMVRRADSYDMTARSVDGMDVEAVADVVREAADRARAGEGPTFIEAHTYRFCGHMPGDTEPYRTSEEVEAERRRDPLLLARNRLLELGVTAAEVERVTARAEEDVAAAEESARAAPEPSLASLGHGAADFMDVTR
jgi:TPP-dependent pyruvate/acetoin dehydrogenase alpha subunit